MSKVGKKPIVLPAGVEVTIEKANIKVKWPKGELSYAYLPGVQIKQEENTLVFNVDNEELWNLWGLTRTLVANMVEGVTNGYQKSLLLTWVGYSVKLEGKKLIFSLGFAHKVNFEIPAEFETKVEQDAKGNYIITLSGIEKQKLGEVAAKIRSLKKPEPYKGKGIRYENEYVKIKPGKSAKK